MSGVANSPGQQVIVLGFTSFFFDHVANLLTLPTALPVGAEDGNLIVAPPRLEGPTRLPGPFSQKVLLECWSATSPASGGWGG